MFLLRWIFNDIIFFVTNKSFFISGFDYQSLLKILDSD